MKRIISITCLATLLALASCSSDDGATPLASTTTLSPRATPAPTPSTTVVAPITTVVATTTTMPATTTTTTTVAPTTTTSVVVKPSSFHLWVATSGMGSWATSVATDLSDMADAANAADVDELTDACTTLRGHLANAPDRDSPDDQFNSLVSQAIVQLTAGAKACIKGDYTTTSTAVTKGGQLISQASDRLNELN